MTVTRAPFKSMINAAILLATPFIVFIRYNGYPIFTPEIALGILITVVVGALLGLVFEIAGQHSRMVGLAFLITLTADIQMTRDDRGLILWTIFALSIGLVGLVRPFLDRFGTWIFLAVLITGIFTPAQRGAPVIESTDASLPTNTELPPFVNIILDAHIGIEGIPEEFDPSGVRAAAVRDFYLDNDFQVFGRTYSQFFDTRYALPTMVNLSPVAVRINRADFGFDIKANPYFELMRERGYRIHLYQSEYLDYSDGQLGKTVLSSYTYELETLRSIAGTDVSLGSKLHLMFAMFSKLSVMAADLPIKTPGVSALSSMRVFEQLERDLAYIKPGELYFAHIVMPHQPYSYQSDCTINPDAGSWAEAEDKTLGDRRNTPESRAHAYEMYLNQLECVTVKMNDLFDSMKATGVFDKSAILVVGDHGSRLMLPHPSLKYEDKYPMSDQDAIDGFSTLFAFRWPGIPGRYDDRQLPMGALFAGIVTKGILPKGTEWAGEQSIFITDGLNLVRRPMPDFSRDLPERTEQSE